MKFQSIEKYIGSCCQNSFVILDCRTHFLTRNQKISIAKKFIRLYRVDSALFLINSKKADVAFEIFEKDGSQSESCGNGAILIAFLLKMSKGTIKIGRNFFVVHADRKKLAITLHQKNSTINKTDRGDSVFVKFGEPHLVYLVDNLEKFNLIKIGKAAQAWYPGGVNVDVLAKLNKGKYLIKTYERGVLAITKSCGTGSLSSYLALMFYGIRFHDKSIEFQSGGGVHAVTANNGKLQLKIAKKFCKIRNLS